MKYCFIEINHKKEMTQSLSSTPCLFLSTPSLLLQHYFLTLPSLLLQHYFSNATSPHCFSPHLFCFSSTTSPHCFSPRLVCCSPHFLCFSLLLPYLVTFVPSKVSDRLSLYTQFNMSQFNMTRAAIAPCEYMTCTIAGDLCINKK